jgi:predicted metal-dependent HD superfamily phosphohydrolase
VQLADRWAASCAAIGATADPARVGVALLRAYRAPDRGYHDLRHLAEVLDTVDELARDAPWLDRVRLAAWFHDAVYDTQEPTPGASEERSAAWAETELVGLGVAAADAAEVARLVRLTASHDPGPDDAAGDVLCDADLAVLARDPAGYADYAAAVRREYAHVPDAAFAAGRSAILSDLVARPSLFRTQEGRRRWEATARANVAAELTQLSEVRSPSPRSPDPT